MHAHADITSTHIRHMVFIDIYPTSHLSVRMCLCPIQFNGTYKYVRQMPACLPACQPVAADLYQCYQHAVQPGHTHTRPVKSQLKCRKSIMQSRTHGVPGTLNPVPHGTAICWVFVGSAPSCQTPSAPPPSSGRAGHRAHRAHRADTGK